MSVSSDFKGILNEVLDEPVGTSLPEMKKKYSGLSRADRKRVDAHFERLSQNYAEFKKQKYDGLKKAPLTLLDVIFSGASVGVGVAGVVNTVAPGLFSTIIGYIAAKQPQLLAKASLLGIGIFTPHGVSAEIILGIGAVAGIVVYGCVSLIVALLRRIFRAGK